MCKLCTYSGTWHVPVICATHVRKIYITNSMKTSCLEADGRKPSLKISHLLRNANRKFITMLT